MKKFGIKLKGKEIPIFKIVYFHMENYAKIDIRFLIFRFYFNTLRLKDTVIQFSIEWGWK